MKTIAFSHHYPKIHGQVQAKLIAVIPLPGREISEPLLEYDTTFVEDGVAGRFPLKKSGNYIQLLHEPSGVATRKGGVLHIGNR